jgi:hypothetical protein
LVAGDVSVKTVVAVFLLSMVPACFVSVHFWLENYQIFGHIHLLYIHKVTIIANLCYIIQGSKGKEKQK